MKYLLCLWLGLLLSELAFCQSVSTLMGARANGLGYASSTLTDVWGIFNNVAGIAKLEKTSAACAYNLHSSIVGANRIAAALATPLKFGVIGAGVYRFGDDLYNEHVVSAGFSNKFGMAALGGQVNYIQYHTEGFGSKGVVSFNLGGIAELIPQLSVGAYIINITQPSISETEKLPTRLAAGMGFTPIEQVLIIAEIEKDLEYDATGKMGIEYKFHSKFTARTAYTVSPNTAFFGLGFKTKRFNIDYAMEYHAALSFSQQASVSCQLNAK